VYLSSLQESSALLRADWLHYGALFVDFTCFLMASFCVFTWKFSLCADCPDFVDIIDTAYY